MISSLTIKGFLHELESQFGDFILAVGHSTLNNRTVCSAKLTVNSNLETVAIGATSLEAVMGSVRAMEAKLATADISPTSCCESVEIEGPSDEWEDVIEAVTELKTAIGGTSESLNSACDNLIEAIESLQENFSN